MHMAGRLALLRMAMGLCCCTASGPALQLATPASSSPLAGVPRLPKMHFVTNAGLTKASLLANPELLESAKDFARVRYHGARPRA